jgi:hypothetical protein
MYEDNITATAGEKLCELVNSKEKIYFEKKMLVTF